MGSRRMRRLLLGERKEYVGEGMKAGHSRDGKEGKERGSYKEGGGRVVEVFAKTCIIKT